jgi:hypothetical protein
MSKGGHRLAKTVAAKPSKEFLRPMGKKHNAQ